MNGWARRRDANRRPMMTAFRGALISISLLCAWRGHVAYAAGTAGSSQPGGKLEVAESSQSGANSGPLFKLSDEQLGNPLMFVVYGDMRFTDPRERVATSPSARRALVARIASEHPAALFL